MEHTNGKPSSTLSEVAEYPRELPEGMTHHESGPLPAEADRAGQQASEALHQQVKQTSIALEHQPGTAAPDTYVALHTEVMQLRDEFASAMTSLRALFTEGDGNLHEMQLTSLRRQVSQLEGVLESNYQRELRVAEDRETALRSEMAQMRQDLRVALETLYRMPEEAERPTGAAELQQLEQGVTELRSALLGVARDQQQAAEERESGLKAELNHMRRDLLVTLEASYQLPTDRLQGLDIQVASWRGQVEELQGVVLDLQQAQHQEVVQQQLMLQGEIRDLVDHINSSIAALQPGADREEFQAQRAMLARLGEHLEQQSAGMDRRLDELMSLAARGSAATQAESTALRDDIRAMIEALASRLDSMPDSPAVAVLEAVQGQVTDLQSAVASHLDGAAIASEDWHKSVVPEIAALRSELQAGIQPDAAQTEQYRQMISQIAQLQADLDDMRIGMQAMQPADVAGSGLDAAALEQMRALLEATQARAREQEDSASTDEFNRFRYEVQGLRNDLRVVLEAPVNPANSDAGATATDFSAIRAEFAELRSDLARLPATADTGVRAEVAQLRGELLGSIGEWRSALTPQPTMQSDDRLAERVSALELVLRTGQEEQREWMLERDRVLRSQFEDMRSSLASMVAPSELPRAEVNDGWREELAQMRIDLLAGLESVRAATSVPTTTPSHAPAVGESLAALADSLRQSTLEQERVAASQQETLQATITQMREEMRAALNGLTRDGVDSFEKRQSQLRMDQLEMERNLAQLRKELVAAQADPGNKKKLWR